MRLFCNFIFVLLVTIFSLIAVASEETLVDQNVAIYTPISWVDIEPVFIKNSKFALVVDYEVGKTNEINIIDLNDLKNPKLFSKIKCGEKNKYIKDLRVSSDETRMYVAFDKKLKVFDISNINHIKILEEKNIEISSMVLTHDNKYLYVFGQKQNCNSKYCDGLLLYEVKESLNFIKSFDFKGTGLSISPDNNKIAFYSLVEDGLSIVDISKRLELTVYGVDSDSFHQRGKNQPEANYNETVFSPDSKTLYLAAGEAGLIVYDISKNKLKKLQQTRNFYSKFWFHQTDSIYSVDIHDNTLYLAGSSKESKKLSFIKNMENVIIYQANQLEISTDGSFIFYINPWAKPKGISIKKLLN